MLNIVIENPNENRVVLYQADHAEQKEDGMLLVRCRTIKIVEGKMLGVNTSQTRTDRLINTIMDKGDIK